MRKQNYQRNTSLVYYDVTKYYFEIDEQDELRRKGHSKEHRSDPIVFYSAKYAAKAKADRAGAITKAKDLIKHPSKYSQSTSVGAAKYVKNLSFDPKTGEILEDAKQLLRFNEEKLRVPGGQSPSALEELTETPCIDSLQ